MGKEWMFQIYQQTSPFWGSDELQFIELQGLAIAWRFALLPRANLNPKSKAQFVRQAWDIANCRGD
jgi:hypothetical protein